MLDIKTGKYISMLAVGFLVYACGGTTDSNDDVDSIIPTFQAPPPAPEGQFNITASVPQHNSSNMANDSNVTVTFEEPVFSATVNSETIQLVTGNRVVPTSLQYSEGSTRLIIDPQNDLVSNTQYEVRFSDQLMSVDGDKLVQDRIVFTTAGDMGNTPTTVAQGCMTAEDVEMLKQINTARSQARNCGNTRYRAVAPVSFNCQLKEAATRHSLDMARTGNFNHVGTDGSSFGRRIQDTGYIYETASENIAWGQRSVTEVMDTWLKSPGHCRNIMGAEFEEVGTSMELSANNQRFWTQNFATSSSR